MNTDEINAPNGPFESVLTALSDAAANHKNYHEDATEQNAAEALRSLADLYEEKTMPPIGTLAINTRGGLLEAYLRIFEEHSDFDGLHNRVDGDMPIVVKDGVISVAQLEHLDCDYTVTDNRFSAMDNIIALVAQAVNAFNASGHIDVETYDGPSHFEAIEAHCHAFDLLDQSCSAIEECQTEF